MKTRLLIEYDGTEYAGWQQQRNAKTIQGEILRVVQQIHPEAEIELYGAGRTDAGVHARGQVAHLVCPDALDVDVLRNRINDFLPTDIHVLSLEKVDERFHARHHAKLRNYAYVLSKRRDALHKRHVWWVKDALDVGRMREAARTLVGFHDFVSFSDEKPAAQAPRPEGEKPNEKSTWVQLVRCEVIETAERVRIEVVGSHFLRKMVRRIVGCLVEVGAGRMDSSRPADFLKKVDRTPATFTAPPSGLFLEKVEY